MIRNGRPLVGRGVYGVRNNMPVIMMEKMWRPEPDMYIMIAFMGILRLKTHAKDKRWTCAKERKAIAEGGTSEVDGRKGGLRLCRCDSDFPRLLHLQIILFHSIHNPILILLLPLQINHTSTDSHSSSVGSLTFCTCPP